MEKASSWLRGRYPTGCTASVCQELESASQSGTAAHPCNTTQFVTVTHNYRQDNEGVREIICSLYVLCSRHKVVELSSSFLQSLQCSCFSSGLKTDHHTLQRKQLVTILHNKDTDEQCIVSGIVWFKTFKNPNTQVQLGFPQTEIITSIQLKSAALNLVTFQQ